MPEPSRQQRGSAPSSRHGGWRSRLQIHRETAADSLARMTAAPLTTLMTLAVIGIALLLPAVLLVATDNIRTLTRDLETGSRINVYLEQAPDQARLESMSEDLLSRSSIQDLDYISAEQAAETFAAESGFGDILDSLPDNPLPATLVIHPATTEYTAVRELAQSLEGLPEAGTVQIDLQWLQRLDGFLELTRRATTAMLIILSVAVLFVVGNTIRLAIVSRRAEIQVAKLVGATDSFVARPFLYTGLWYGAGGGLCAWLLLNLTTWMLSAPVERLLALYESQHELQWPGATALLALVGGGAALGWLGALISVRQHLATIEPRSS